MASGIGELDEVRACVTARSKVVDVRELPDQIRSTYQAANPPPYFWPRAPNVIHSSGVSALAGCAAGNEQENQYSGFERHLVSPVSSRNDILCL